MSAADLALVLAVSLEERDGAPTRAYRELRYQTRDSWTRERRVVAKAEWLGDKSNSGSGSRLSPTSCSTCCGTSA